MTAARAVPIALFTLLFAAGAVAQTAPTGAQKERDALQARAVENCKANRGVDCDKPQGLQEWEMLERSRAQAVGEGTHRRLPLPAQGTQKSK